MTSNFFASTPVMYLRSALFSAGQLLSTLVFTPLSLASALLSFRGRHRVINTWCRFNVWWLRVTCGVRHRVHGREHIPNLPAAIVMAKHQSAWETMALSAYFPPLVWVVKQELLRIPGYGWGLAVLEPIAIDRNEGRQALRRLVEQGRERLSRGRWVLIFPEGSRMPPGAPPRYRSGGARLAAESGVPVVPVALNSGLFWPSGRFLKRPGCIDVVIGPPIPTAGRSTQEILRAVEGWIEARMAELPGPDGGDARGGDIGSRAARVETAQDQT